VDNKAVIGKTNQYSGLQLVYTQTLRSQVGIKSIFFNSDGTKLYALYLEGMHIDEFSQTTKKLLRRISFKPTKSPGLDYKSNRIIPSFAEKPVEACFTHAGKILWVSLHNAGGISPIILDSSILNRSTVKSRLNKTTYINDLERGIKTTVEFPVIQTGKIPKVIAKTANDKYLLVSNWGSKTISVLMINDSVPPYGTKIATIPTSATPRGIAVDDKNNNTYVGIMGGNTIIRINNKTWKVEKNIIVPKNPRHLIMDSLGHLFVSFNEVSEVACIETKTDKLLFKAQTHSQPRTIALSGNQKFLFITCYAGNKLDIFKINNRSFQKLYAINCPGKPVGIAIYENEKNLEAWVCNYAAGYIKVFTFIKT
jgi:DNA-binding beta-propeller fold protein YncE